MKKIIIILSAMILMSCQKETSTPTPTPQPLNNTPPNTVQNTTVTINIDPHGIGYLFANWDYTATQFVNDSMYSQSVPFSTTRVLTSDSIQLHWISKNCSVCTNNPCDVSLYVNGLLVQSWLNDMGGSSPRYFKIK